MKAKTTRKWINDNFRCFRVGYCDLQDVFSRDDAKFYTCGVYGWNFDAFVDYEYNIAITTGYRNMCGDRIPSEILKKYIDEAKKIKEQYSAWTEYETRSAKLDTLKKALFTELNNI